MQDFYLCFIVIKKNIIYDKKISDIFVQFMYNDVCKVIIYIIFNVLFAQPKKFFSKNRRKKNKY